MTEPSSNCWCPGPLNLITDVAGLAVGHAQDETLKTGVSVLCAEQPFTAAVDVMGGAPGTRETDCLSPDRLVQQTDALVLSGGSAFGLEAASGVADSLAEQNRGFAVGPFRVPIVPAAIIFDLMSGGEARRIPTPYRALGQQAFEERQVHFKPGTIGAGTGATTAALKGGLGSASLVLPSAHTVGALVVANPHGHVTVPDTPHFWAAPFEMQGEYGGLGMPAHFNPERIPDNHKFAAFLARFPDHAQPVGQESGGAGLNTTIAIVATDARLDKAQLKRMAVAAQDGIARAVVPAHTAYDGDLVFAISTGDRAINNGPDDCQLIGHAAAVCLARAIARAIYHARSEPDDILPTWQHVYANG